MAMPRKGRPEVASKAELTDAVAKLTSDIGKLATKEDLSVAVTKLALEIDKRASKADMDAGFARMDAKFDKIFGVLDRVTGELLDNRQSHTLFGAMLGDHRRTLASHDQRLTSLESRLPPRTP